MISTIEELYKAQNAATSRWHQRPPSGTDALINESKAEALKAFVLAQHWQNFSLWHEEDQARRTDVPDKVIADCKRKIDALNQRRNDFIEKLDAKLVQEIYARWPDIDFESISAANTETLGSVFDRMSILSLKLFHMQEQAERPEASAEHRLRCREKAEKIELQRNRLAASSFQLIKEYEQGLKTPVIFYQFKMYNDPELNPELYGAAQLKPLI